MKHDHRSSMLFISGGAYAWCYRCGAIRMLNFDGRYRDKKWTKPTGMRGKNPALVDTKVL